jgi:hypothetical protein
MTRNISRQLDDEALPAANKSETVNLISILPLILANQDGKLLLYSTKHSLRLTCKAAKAAVNPALRTAKIGIDGAIFSNNDLFNTFCRSPITLAATKLYCECGITKAVMNKLLGVQFNYVQDASFTIDSSALDLLACRWQCGGELKVLDLRVYWHYTTDSPSQFNSVWKNFSKAKWPLLEALCLKIDPVDFRLDPPSDDEHDFPDTDVGEVACLLSYFPSLKHLELSDSLKLADVKAIAAVPHEKLERVELDFSANELDHEQSETGCTAALAEAKWPQLRELKLYDLMFISKDDVSALLKATWFNNLKKLHLACFRREAANVLFAGLQFSAVETLQLDHVYFDALLAFKEPIEFPKLKSFGISILRRAEEDDSSSQNTFNVGLSSFFSKTKLPCLESLTIISSYYNSNGGLRPWNMPPSFANNTVEPSVLPSLKRLVMQGFQISQDCSGFLGSLYSRGNCEVDLHRCIVESSLDSPEFEEILTSFSLQRSAFDDKLRSLKLYEKAVWYSSVSMDTLKSIAASMYLSNLAVHVNGLLEPVTACVALAEVAGAAQETSVEGELLQRSHNEILEAASGLFIVCVAVNIGGSSGGGGSGPGQ